MTRKQIEKKTKAIVAGVLMVKESKVRPDAWLMIDLNADSIDFVEMVIELEKNFGIDISDEETEFCDTWTVKELYDFIEKKVTAKEEREKTKPFTVIYSKSKTMKP